MLGLWFRLLAQQRNVGVTESGKESLEFLCFFRAIKTGWWFGTRILFSHILGIMIPTDFPIFQRVETTNQKRW
jgi:hypothetical protein